MEFIAPSLALILGFGLGGLVGWLYTQTLYQSRLAKMEAVSSAQDEKLAWVNNAEATLRSAFAEVSMKSLKASSKYVTTNMQALLQGHITAIDKIRGSLESRISSSDQHFDQMTSNLTTRLHENLTTHSAVLSRSKTEIETKINTLDSVVRQLETKREGAYQQLRVQLSALQQASIDLHETTHQLESALRSRQIRGKWGEIQLRKVIELAGMSEHISFNEQVAADEGVPYVVIRLPNGGSVPVDAKFPMDAYLRAMDAGEPSKYDEEMVEHSKSVRAMIKSLSAKRYWESMQPAPDLVILFVPIESCLNVLFHTDPAIIDFATESKVILATPVTLVCFLKSIAYGWQQFVISKNAKEILDLSADLYRRTAKWLEHLSKTGDKLSAAVESYNSTVSSLQSRFIPQLRKFEQLAALKGDIEDVKEVSTNITLPPKYES